jgi:NAD(P)-dependent dehydrogenase (short-subunit alcohol dehydrogenase family)
VQQGFADRVAIVTGAGKGIGRAIALALAAQGVRVVVNNRSHAGEAMSSAQELTETIVTAGGSAVANTDSIEQQDAPARMVEQALSAFGRLDIVVNNAAIAPQKRISTMPEAMLREVFEINYFGPVALTQAALPALRQSGSGRLIYIISNGGLYGGDGLSAYASTKGALYAFMRCAAVEGARYGICANALAPFAASQMTDGSLNEALREALPPSWIGPVAAWLASSSCTVSGKVYVTGGGRIREARVEETASVQFGEPGPSAIDEVATGMTALASLPAEHTFANAVEAFAHTMADIATGSAPDSRSMDNA